MDGDSDVGGGHGSALDSHRGISGIQSGSKGDGWNQSHRT